MQTHLPQIRDFGWSFCIRRIDIGEQLHEKKGCPLFSTDLFLHGAKSDLYLSGSDVEPLRD